MLARARPATAPLAVVGAMVVYSMTLWASLGEGVPTGLALLAAPVAFFVVIYLHYGVARLTFRDQHLWVVGGAAVGVSVTLFALGGVRTEIALTGWLLALVAGVASGHLARRGIRTRSIYITAALLTMALALAHFYPLWQVIVSAAPEMAVAMTESARRSVALYGGSPEQVHLIGEQVRRMLTVLFRLVPGEMALSAVTQFSIGFLLFVRWLDRHHLAPPRYERFMFWKAPFGLTPALIGLIALRLTGGEVLRIAADNALLVLGVFYMVTGLAIIEYWLRKRHLSTLMRITAYVALIVIPLTSLIMSIIIGGAVSLLGFIDSFTDWRRVRLRELG